MAFHLKHPLPFEGLSLLPSRQTPQLKQLRNRRHTRRFNPRESAIIFFPTPTSTPSSQILRSTSPNIMNNLFSSSWRRNSADFNNDIQLSNSFPSRSINSSSSGGGGANLDRFFEDVESIKDELKEVESLHRSLHTSNETLRTLHAAVAVRDLRSRMDADVAQALKKAKLIKLRLESLDRANASNRSAPGCGPGTSTDRTRSSVVAGLRKKLKESMQSFASLRGKVNADYKETMERRYYTVTGEKPDEATVEALAASGEGEQFLARAIREQGRGEVMEVVKEMQERHGAAAELEKNLLELHQVFLDMSVLVAAQGEQIDDIEAQVGRAKSFINRGTGELVEARKHQKNSRKWTCIGIGLLLVVILIIVIPIVLKK